MTGSSLMPALALLALMAPPALASSRVGNGGNAIVCFNNTQIVDAIRANRTGVLDEYLGAITRLEPYDLYQAELPRGEDSQPPKLMQMLPNETPRAYIERLAKRLDNSLPGLSEQIRYAMALFPTDNIVMEGNPLLKVDDANEVSDFVGSRNCVLTTMAINYRSGDHYFLHIDSRLFNHPVFLSKGRLAQSVLLLHEWLYTIAKNFHKQEDSRKTRDLISFLLKDGYELPLRDFWNLVIDLGFERGTMDLKYESSYGSNYSRSGIPYDSIVATLPGHTLNLFSRDMVGMARTIYNEEQDELEKNFMPIKKSLNNYFGWMRGGWGSTLYGNPLSLSNDRTEALSVLDVWSKDIHRIEWKYQNDAKNLLNRARALLESLPGRFEQRKLRIAQALTAKFDGEWKAKLHAIPYAPDQLKEVLETEARAFITSVAKKSVTFNRSRGDSPWLSCEDKAAISELFSGFPNQSDYDYARLGEWQADSFAKSWVVDEVMSLSYYSIRIEDLPARN